jgi:hypothetical protein
MGKVAMSLDRTAIAICLTAAFILCECGRQPQDLARDLVAATRSADPDKVKALLDAGADPTLAGNNKISAIDAAAIVVNKLNNAGALPLDWSGKEEKTLFLLTSAMRGKKKIANIEGPISVKAEYGGVGASGINMIADIVIHDNIGDHIILLSSFETATKGIKRTSLNQVSGVFPIVVGDRYKVRRTQYQSDGCEASYIEWLGGKSAPPMSVPVGEVFSSTAHILNTHSS